MRGTGSAPAPPVAGVDGAAGRWVVAVLAERTVRLRLAESPADVLRATADCAVIGVDMPLTVPVDGTRASETALRAFLGPARSSLFPTPVADAVRASSYEDACAASRARTGKAISKQAWFLCRHILDWSAALGAAPDRNRVIEVHPESSFRALAPDVAFGSKKRARGLAQRLAALGAVVDLADVLAATAALDDGLALDDVLDAVAAAWSAGRWRDGEALVFGASADDRIVV
ncbi:DUF429 domain-containing protein [Rhodococcoides corynebacterioides]|uniref:DUF429 domain-containing protein n=1 Tax=Rhodococcoides corynebacterioides TaxID=53972 RepID=A0ABS7P810_9NOCA|nr:DUF429 domain-containing protein [Rhodococcus corynebacterioides]MBY6368553.1 DUF429 domain-containing protein [Rhodococcus corynebacterioides]MBY6409478.1 DUF429 domain-containing protein [Rhodococcus corynebacterioides]